MPFHPFGMFGGHAQAQAQRTNEPPDHVVDPLTLEPFVDPVVLCETGHTYERSSLRQWLLKLPASHWRDPQTNVMLTTATVCPNFAVRDAVRDWQGSDLPAPESTKPQHLRLLHAREQLNNLLQSCAPQLKLLSYMWLILLSNLFADPVSKAIIAGPVTACACMQLLGRDGRLQHTPLQLPIAPNARVEWRPPPQPSLR